MATQDKSIVVRLLIFSGRPDPEWPLDEETALELRDRMAAILQADRVEKAPSNALGYRGFLVRNPGKVADLPTEFVVYSGVLTEHPGPQAQLRRDAGNIEQFLLTQARRRGFGELLDAAGVKGGDNQSSAG